MSNNLKLTPRLRLIRDAEIQLFGRQTHSRMAVESGLTERSIYYWFDKSDSRYGKVDDDALDSIARALDKRIGSMIAVRDRILQDITESSPDYKFKWQPALAA